jgi:hypothetical protein
MNEQDFAKLLDNVGRLTIDQHCKLLYQLHYIYRNNYPNFPRDLYLKVTWRIKQAYQLVNFYLNPPKHQ